MPDTLKETILKYMDLLRDFYESLDEMAMSASAILKEEVTKRDIANAIIDVFEMAESMNAPVEDILAAAAEEMEKAKAGSPE